MKHFFFCILFVISFREIFIAEEPKIIPIVMTSDDIYVRVTLVALTSLFENQKPHTFYQISILIPGNLKHHSEIMIATLGKEYKNFDVKLVTMAKRYDSTEDPPMMHHPSLFYKLSSPILFPDLKKCIILDSDVIVRRDLTEMYDINMDGYYVGGVYEGQLYYAPNTFYSNEFIERKLRILEMPDFKQYINTGVSVWNLKNMRENKVFEKFTDFIKKKRKYFCEIFDLYSDQDVINPVCYGKIMLLSMEYGLIINVKEYYQINFEEINATVVHFAGRGKPWWQPWKSKFHTEFWRYARKTGFFKEEVKMFDSMKSRGANVRLRTHLTYWTPYKKRSKHKH